MEMWVFTGECCGLSPAEFLLWVGFFFFIPELQKRIRRSAHAQKETEFLRLKRTRLGLEDFESLKVIGRGAFGEVSPERGLMWHQGWLETCTAHTSEG